MKKLQDFKPHELAPSATKKLKGKGEKKTELYPNNGWVVAIDHGGCPPPERE